jgi:phosphatidylglycerophosphate synthase
LSPSDRARLDRAVKPDDSPFTTFLVSPWSKYIAWTAAQRGLTPNQVTTVSLAVAVLAAGCFAVGQRPTYVVGAVLLQVSFGLDCADGQLARLTSRFSPLGGWLDAMFDRLKEYLVYAGLAVGAARTGDDVWLLAALALALQTVRHTVDSAYAVTPAAVRARNEGVERRAAGGRRRWHWGRKIAILPIGERWALISVLAAFTTPRIVFVALLVAGGLAAGYMLAAQVRHSLRPSDDAVTPDASSALWRMCDAGPIASAVARAVGGGRSLPPRWGWVVPPLLRAGEYATVLAAARLSGAGVGALTYAYLLALVWHHYDADYRSRHRVAASSRSVAAGLGGFEVRLLAVVALAAAGPGAYTVGIAILTGLLGIVAVVEAVDLRRRLEPAEPESAGRSGDT